MSDFSSIIMKYLLSFIFIIPALTMHEWAHAWMSNRLGDPTPRMLGRLTLNPLKHIDPFGTVLMPIALLVMSGGQFAFGYAKPVPVNPRYYRDSRHGMLLVGLAGPGMNVLLAVISGLLVRGFVALQVLGLVGWGALGTILGGLTTVLITFCYLNLALCFFNLLPIPPFDGSRVVQKYLKGEARRWYAMLEQYGIYIILALVWVVPMMTGFDVIEVYFTYTVNIVFRILTGLPI